MAIIIQQLLNATQLGAVYALIALGYSMVYGIIRLINFAHGDIFMVGAFIGFLLATLAGLPFYVIMPLAMLLTALVGVAIERIAYRKLRNAQRMSLVITALGVGIFLENIVRVLVGPQTRQLPPLLPDAILQLPGGIVITEDKILIILISLALMMILWLFVNKTLMGTALRAVADNKEIVPLMGINLNQVIAVTFAIGSALAAAGGIFFGQAYSIDPYMGIDLGWKAFIAAVIGGIGSIEGAVLGSFMLAEVEVFSVAYLSSNLKNGIAFGLLIVLLLIWPSGIMGKPMLKKV
ncbi:branched-chain amino acid transport system permease protein [Hydrogenispora ethanolica]|uniref:Branched-chain amino acid transport system permease protein n=1 Tax=Hydrogenispora ethanolica TaxID=1082276 RepID=A0A4R1R909_HYDET|nr:branched-chain amino acid ABC transporter permease [Hydrogenispora ethanolica]TCL62156.1 branched-chain amino acid transport system permease protein [Hydrogenispora ethanolica]